MPANKPDWGNLFTEYETLVATAAGVTLKDFCESRQVSYTAARKQFSRRSAAAPARPAKQASRAKVAAVAKQWEEAKEIITRPASLVVGDTLEALIERDFVSPEDAAILRRHAKAARDFAEEVERKRLELVEEIANPSAPVERDPDEDSPAPKASPTDRLYLLLANSSIQIGKLENSLLDAWQLLEKHRFAVRQQAQRDSEENRRRTDFDQKQGARGTVTEGLRLKKENNWSYIELGEWLTAAGVWTFPDFITIQIRAELENDEDLGDESVTYTAMSDEEITRRAEEDAKRLHEATQRALEKQRLMDEFTQEDIGADLISGGHADQDGEEWDDSIDDDNEQALLAAVIKKQMTGGVE